MFDKLSKGGLKRIAMALFSGYLTEPHRAASIFGGKFCGFGETFTNAACEGAVYGDIADGAFDDATGHVHTRVIGSTAQLMTSANGGALAATAAIERQTSGEDAGCLSLSMAGVDATAAVSALTQTDASGNAVEWINEDENFVMEVEVKDFTGSTLPATKGLVQMGVLGGIAGTFTSDVLAAPATDGMYLQIEEGRVYAIVLVGGTEYKSSPLPVRANDGETAHFELEHSVGVYQNTFSVRQRSKSGSAVSVSYTKGDMTNNFQVFTRVGHANTFAAATDTALTMKISSISLNKV